jgi:hypothetical protein
MNHGHAAAADPLRRRPRSALGRTAESPRRPRRPARSEARKFHIGCLAPVAGGGGRRIRGHREAI